MVMSNVWQKDYDAFNVSKLSKYKNTIDLEHYVYNTLIDVFAIEHHIKPSDISFNKDRLIYNGESIGACALTKIGYKYNFIVEVTDSFKAEYYCKE